MTFFSWLRKKAPPESATADPSDALGYHRAQLAYVAGLRAPVDPLDLTGKADPVTAYERFAEAVDDAWGHSDDWLQRSLVGGLRLTSGHLTGADVVLGALPPKQIVLDNGAGRGPLAPAGALLVALPIPDELDCGMLNLIAGSKEAASLKSWLQRNREHLVWERRSGTWRMK